MFVRYLGGGIGHLEQFPPAERNFEDSASNDNGDTEFEMDDLVMGASSTGDDEGEEDEGKEGEGEEDEGEEEEGDPGELSDEETGNVY